MGIPFISNCNSNREQVERSLPKIGGIDARFSEAIPILITDFKMVGYPFRIFGWEDQEYAERKEYAYNPEREEEIFN